MIRGLDFHSFFVPSKSDKCRGERTGDHPLHSTNSWWLSWCSEVLMREGLKVLKRTPSEVHFTVVHTKLAQTEDDHTLSHLNYAIAMPWYTVHCRVCTSRLRWLPPCCGSLQPFLLCKAVVSPLPWILLSFSQHFLQRSVSTCTAGTI